MPNERETLKKWKLKTGDCLFYMHIPKTGGTTIYKYLKELFGQENVLIYPDSKYPTFFEGLYPDQFSQFRFFRQHAKYTFYKYLPRKPVYITFLRHPVTRVISFYRHVCRVKTHSLHADVVRNNVGITDFVEHFPLEEIENLQVKFFAGYSTAKETDKDLLEIALMRLHEFAFFGILESFTESIRLLSYTFDWEIGELGKENAAPTPTCIDNIADSAVQAILEKNTLDMKLYEEAEVLFTNRINELERIHEWKNGTG